MLAQYHTTRHDTTRYKDGDGEPPDGIETEDGCVGYQSSDDAARSSRMHTDLPPEVDHNTGTLYEQRDADDCHQEVGHVCEVENMHEAEIAADIDDVGNGTLVALTQVKSTPLMYATVDIDAQDWQTEREEVNEYE